MENKKAIILNSGGFDSVCLVHKLMEEYKAEELISLFFIYGQRNVSKERDMSQKVANKFGIKHIEIELPKFTWDSTSLLFNETEDCTNVEGQYLAMRNLIFFSYATSLAESTGCDYIYSAILEGGTYSDTTEEFVNNFYTLVKDSTNINFETPFIDLDKPDLLPIVRRHGIDVKDFFSCNIPNELGEPCGKCGDCTCLEDLYKEVQSTKYHDLVLNGCSSIECEEAFRNIPITTAKLFINNVCNMDCKHCLFTGMVYPRVLSIEEWKPVFDQLHEMGIKTIDFGGKEPLVSRKVFKLMEYCKEKGYDFKYTMITNGKNVIKYIDLLEEYNVSVAMSVESLKQLKSRESVDIIKNIKALQRRGLDVSLSVDCHKYNYKQVPKLVTYLDRLDIDIYIKTIRPLGRNKEFIRGNMMLSSNEIMKVIKNIKTVNRYVNFSLSPFDVENARGELKDLINNYIIYRDPLFNNEVILDIATEDKDFLSHLTISSNGHVIGNGEYLSEPTYTKYSIGNVRDTRIKDMPFKNI